MIKKFAVLAAILGSTALVAVPASASVHDSHRLIDPRHCCR